MGKPRYAKIKEWARPRTDPRARSHINRPEYMNLLTLGIKARPCRPGGLRTGFGINEKSHKKIT